MTSLLLILKLFGGLILLFIFGRIVGHFLNLDNYYESSQKRKIGDIHKYKNEVDNNFPKLI
jgi:hypothetical protein